MFPECGAAFLWDAGNLDHIARHQVTRDEVQSAFSDAYSFLVNTEWRKFELRYQMLGETDEGRILTVIFIIRSGQIRTVTAFAAQKKNAVAYALRRDREHGTRAS